MGLSAAEEYVKTHLKPEDEVALVLLIGAHERHKGRVTFLKKVAVLTRSADVGYIQVFNKM